MIISINSAHASLANAGGKAANLASLANAGFNVPGGFVVTTEAYRVFVEVNDLEEAISGALSKKNLADLDSLEKISSAIRHLFTNGTIPLILETALKEAHLELEHTPLAVRSSATAEDLPDSSFAGQQDTFLNVVGYENMKKAVVDCWSSLWTPRAIAYRARNDIPQTTVAIAVVVQEMVESDVSGVMFTANPLNGLRNQIVIDSTFGLGESLVSGQVEPDHFVLSQNGEILAQQLGSKSISLHGRKGGGVIRKKTQVADRFTLSEAQINELAEVASAVQQHFGSPQDIEWAFAGHTLHLLQSRPITSLYPLPDLPAEPLLVLFSFGAVQGMLDPITPLGQDTIRLFFAGGASLFGYEVTHETQGVLHSAGERLWGNLTPIIRNTLGRRIAFGAIGGVDPGSKTFLEELANDPRILTEVGRPSFRTIRRFARFGRRNIPGIVKCFLNPERARKNALRSTERFLNQVGIQARAISGPPETVLRQRVGLYETLRESFPIAVPTLAVSLLSGMVAYNIIYRFGKKAGIPQARLLELFRGLPHNPTTEMDLALWQVAAVIRDLPEAKEIFQRNTAEDLAARYQENRLPAEAQSALGHYFEKYGMRGVAEIDFGRQRWGENPTPILKSLQTYLTIPRKLAPDILFRQGELTAEEAFRDVIAALRGTRFGLLKALAAKWAYKRFKALAGLREMPKFFIVRFMGIVRDALLVSGTDLVMSGHLNRREDIFFLRINELKGLAEHKLNPAALLDIVERRKLAYRVEMRRKQIPRLLLSNGQVYYERAAGITGKDAPVITGSAVSPGVVEGKARIVRDPTHSELKTGEIMVCAGTDPAWTPLFLTAGGLVMEVGGLMTHGSVVAREYGIPAVVGVHQATEIIRTGMKIRVDGSTGTIEILE